MLHVFSTNLTKVKKKFDKHTSFNIIYFSKLIIDQAVVFLVVKSVHPDLSPRLNTGARIFLDLFQDLTALCF